MAVVPKVVVAGKEKVSETFHEDGDRSIKSDNNETAKLVFSLVDPIFSSVAFKTYPYIFVKYSLISCFVILGTTRNVAVAGCVNVAFFAPTITIGIDGIHILN